MNVRQALEDALSSKYAGVMIMARLYKQGLQKVLNMSEHGTTSFNNA